jgi:hypothetical protein
MDRSSCRRCLGGSGGGTAGVISDGEPVAACAAADADVEGFDFTDTKAES